METKFENRAGGYVSITGGIKAFIPAALPPDPQLKLEGDLLLQISEADQALGRLDSITLLLPNPDLFVSMYVRNEAVYSSQIEGTQASLSDLLEYEVETSQRRQRSDAAEVHNYVSAMNHGLERLKEIPLSNRLLKEIHAVLLEGVRGASRARGEFRNHQVHLGIPGSSIAEAMYVPPPANHIGSAMSDLEIFINEDFSLPILIKCGLVHAQFEMIHPFLDGNGRIGRLLITFLLCWNNTLKRPLLYLSDYLKQNRDEYYIRLKNVSDRGDWEGWLKFFLIGIRSVSLDATETAQRILALREQHRDLIRGKMPKAGSAHQLLDLLYKTPIVRSRIVADTINISQQTAIKLLQKFEKLGLLKEVTGRSKGRRYMYLPYLELFS